MSQQNVLAKPGRQVWVQKLSYDGKPGYGYAAELLEADDRIVVRAPFQSPHGRSVFLPDVGISLDEGDLFIEYYYRDRWYNIMKIFEPTGQLKGYYCNISMPAEFDGRQLTWRDLTLDVFIFPDGSYKVLDEADFEASDLYPFEVKARARAAVRELIDQASGGEPPFDELKGRGLTPAAPSAGDDTLKNNLVRP